MTTEHLGSGGHSLVVLREDHGTVAEHWKILGISSLLITWHRLDASFVLGVRSCNICCGLRSSEK